jgi:hypothetical protein
MRQQNRDPVTSKAVLRRIHDVDFASLPDPRGRQGTRHAYLTLVHALLLGCLLAVRSLRSVEALCAYMALWARRQLHIPGRISDTKLRDTLLGLGQETLVMALHRQVKAEHRRGSLEPCYLPFGFAALDGKQLAMLDDWRHEGVQEVHPDKGVPYGLARVHRAFLLSSRAQVCLHQRAVPGDTNEIGAVCDFTSELITAYAQTDLFEVLGFDAGNSSLAHATLIHQANLGYLAAIKSNCGDIHTEAVHLLANRTAEQAQWSVKTREHGTWETRRLWRVSIPGYLGWTHARQVVRVQRLVENERGVVSEGNRYYVTNLPAGRLKSQGWLTMIRLYWRIENNGNWTTDVVWKEDTRRVPWIRVPEAVFALSLLRMMALNLLSVLRSMSRREWDSRSVPWNDVVQALYVLFKAVESNSLGLPLDI